MSVPAEADGSTISAELTQRETEVIRWLCDGLAECEIAKLLDISPKTVSAHKTNIYRKLGVTKITALVRWAIRERVIDP